MKHTFKDEEGHLIADVSFDKEEIAKASQKAIAKLAGLVTVPGFRKGKAPIDRAITMSGMKLLISFSAGLTRISKLTKNSRSTSMAISF